MRSAGSGGERTLRLTRIPGERRMYVVRGVGTLRLTGWGSRTATAEGGGLSWQIAHRGIRQPVFQATDAAGDVVGDFRERTLDHGGVLQWSDREFDLRPHGLLPGRYALVEDGRTWATIEGPGGWGRRPVKIFVDDPGEIDPGPLLFAVFVVATLAQSTHGTATAA
jgi:hypothetical protein